jgi:hypothetical protein
MLARPLGLRLVVQRQMWAWLLHGQWPGWDEHYGSQD